MFSIIAATNFCFLNSPASTIIGEQAVEVILTATFVIGAAVGYAIREIISRRRRRQRIRSR